MAEHSIIHADRGKGTVLPIQYLRGVAAIMVVWCHISVQISSFEPFLPVGFGITGVDLFFVISGFIMQITTANSPIRPLEFMIRRVIRVAPLYWALTLLIILAWFLLPHLFKTLIVTPETLLESLLFIPHFSNSFPQKIFPLLVPGWTLNYEMFFYLVFACTLVLHGTNRIKALAAVMVGLVCIGIFLGPFDTAAMITYTSPLLLEFLAGVLIGQFWLSRREAIGFKTGLLLFLVGWAFLIGNSLQDENKYFPIIGATLVIAGSINTGFLKFKSRSLQILGDATYSVYLTHILSLGVIRVIWVKLAGDGANYFNAFAFAFVSMVICALVGIAAYSLVERPFTRYLNRKVSFGRVARDGAGSTASR